ncbi:MAG TPA: neutral/alkaline non-lysosomal ceramidase N-terminal domain-containing protein, partial [Acidothermaceae bacterium]|nr:neutral/alkaline non-lysosomal ceramidase N-terminal domain-containing protein [Acidothermaceae bacterium]
MIASLLAGVAVSDITPPRGSMLAGFAARSVPSEGIHDPLFARAVALDDGRQGSIVIAADLVALTVGQCDGVRRRVREHTGLGVESVLVSVTHTHAGPHVSDDGLG